MTKPTDGLPPEGGPWTSHGHPIPGVTVYPTPEGMSQRPPVARCGGVPWCTDCQADAADHAQAAK